MTISELKRECERAIQSPVSGGKVSFMIKGNAGRGNSKKSPATGILGEMICGYDGECLCVFDAKKILTAIEDQEVSAE